MSAPIRFFKPDERHGWLSNFAAYSVVVDGRVWPTTEHYYQAMKFDDVAIQERIRSAGSPDKARHLARDTDGKRKGWADRRLDVMTVAVYAKFTQHLDLRQKLLATGDAPLIEASPHDKFFGEGADKTGANHLGCLLEQVRATFRSSAPDLPVGRSAGSPPGAATITVVPSHFVKGDHTTGFGWMIKQPSNADALFIFNDNEEEFYAHLRHGRTGECTPGGGVAAIRPEQCRPDPQLAGIPTGSHAKGGYQRLQGDAKKAIDLAFDEIDNLLASGRFARVIYPASKSGRIGTSIFEVGDEVRDYITDRLRGLARP